MIFFKQNPFVRLFLFALLGIIGASIFEKQEVFPVFSIAIATIFFIASIVLLSSRRLMASYRYRWVHGAATSVVFIAMFWGYSLYRQVEIVDKQGQFEIEGKVEDVIGVRDNKLRAAVSVFRLANDTFLLKGPIKALVTIKVSGADANQFLGRTISGSGWVAEMPQPKFPFQFNYGKYLQRNGYAFQMFLTEVSFCDSTETVSFALSPFIWMRRHFRQRFALAMNDVSLQGVVQALIIGDRSQIDGNLRDAYVKAGAIHILAVSGMHVGILFLLVSSLLSFLRKHKLLFTVVCLSFLWFYAGLTGCPASVLRATIMFSVILVGGQMSRKTPIYNLLALSGFVIVVIDPNHAFNAGFWLSHLAVLGIVMFYRSINEWVVFRFPPFQWIWSIVAVSLSAQIFTFPLMLMLFNGFPVYFLLSNILILPVVSIALVGSLLLAVLPLNVFVFDMVAGMVSSLVAFMNNSAVWVSSLPAAYWQRISMTVWEVLLYLASVLLLVQFVEFRRVKWLWLSMAAMFVLFFSLTCRIVDASLSNSIFADFQRNKAFVNINLGRENLLVVASDEARKNALTLLGGYWGQCFSAQPTIIYCDTILHVGLDSNDALISTKVFANPADFFSCLKSTRTDSFELSVCLQQDNEMVFIKESDAKASTLYLFGKECKRLLDSDNARDFLHPNMRKEIGSNRYFIWVD